MGIQDRDYWKEWSKAGNKQARVKRTFISKVTRDSRWLPIVFFWVGLMLILFVVVRFFRP